MHFISEVIATSLHPWPTDPQINSSATLFAFFPKIKYNMLKQ